MYSYTHLARIALFSLLPREAVYAQRAWRVGLLAGLANTGKTLLTQCMRGLGSGHTVPTIGLAPHVASFGRWVFGLHELGGRDSFRRHWRYYVARLARVDFVVFVVDACRRDAFDDAHAYLQRLVQHYPHTPLLVIFNNFRSTTTTDGATTTTAATPTATATSAAAATTTTTTQPRTCATVGELEQALRLQRIRVDDVQRSVLVCSCDVSSEAQACARMPPALRAGLRRLSSVLLQRSDAAHTPPLPKGVCDDDGDSDDGDARAAGCV